MRERASNFALERSLAHDIRLVVLDVDMPRLDRLETLAKARELVPELRAVVMSGRLSHVARARAAGADAFMAKPFAIGVFVRVVQRLMGERNARSMSGALLEVRVTRGCSSPRAKAERGERRIVGRGGRRPPRRPASMRASLE